GRRTAAAPDRRSERLALQDVRPPRKVLAMTSALAPIADKIGKLIRLLASDRDREVLGAARAIVRTLANPGLDLHTLPAEGIGAANGKKIFSEEEALEIFRQGVEQGRNRQRHSSR